MIAVQHCKKFSLSLNVLPKEMLMLTKEVLLLVLIMFIKLHENIAATYQTKILSCNILSKNAHLSATCHKIWYPSPASTIKKCFDYLICLLQKVSFPERERETERYVCACACARVCVTAYSVLIKTDVGNHITSSYKVFGSCKNFRDWYKSNPSSPALNRASIHFKLQIVTKVKCLFKHQNICNWTVYLTWEPFNNATFY